MKRNAWSKDRTVYLDGWNQNGSGLEENQGLACFDFWGTVKVWKILLKYKKSYKLFSYGVMGIFFEKIGRKRGIFRGEKALYENGLKSFLFQGGWSKKIWKKRCVRHGSKWSGCVLQCCLDSIGFMLAFESNDAKSKLWKRWRFVMVWMFHR